MKKAIYYMVFLSGLGFLLASNAGGKAAAVSQGVTGAPGDEKLNNGTVITCQSCHNSGAYNPTAAISFFDEAGTTAVTKYEVGKTYTIRLTISASGSPAGYGFQMIDIRKSNSANVKGFLAATSQATGIQITAISSGAQANRSYAEQKQTLTSNVINVKWKAPAAGTGAVTFYAVGNAVNRNSSDSGDNGTASVNAEFSELTSGVNELASSVEMSISPNPAREEVVLSLSSKASKNVQVRITDIGGKTVLIDNRVIQVGENNLKLDMSHLIQGAYMIQVIENQNIISKKIFKF
jgi:hypothetical protein